MNPSPAAEKPLLPPTPDSGWPRWVPGLWVLLHYDKAWLSKDLGAGLVLSALLVPAGMGYAEAAGLPPIHGLYATIIPLLAYALFGPSRIMVIGPDSALAALIAGAIGGLAAGDEARAVALAGLLAILTGLLSVGAGLGRLGFVTELLSKPVRVGYMNGIGLTVLISQLPKLLGCRAPGDNLFLQLFTLAAALARGELDLATTGLGLGALALILVLRKVAPKVPGILVAVILATLMVQFVEPFGGVAVVGEVPRGLPWPSLPAVGLADASALVLSALGIALIAFTDTSVMSRAFAARYGERVDPNRELVGLGLANLAAGFFRGFPICSSSSRTPVAESAGSRTQLTGVFGAAVIITLLLAAPGLTTHLPTAALAAVVIAAVLRIFDFAALKIFYRVRRTDFWLSIVAFLSVATLGVIPGIGLAVAMSILDFLRRAWRPHDAILGRAPGVKGYHDLRRYPDARQIPGLLLFRWDAPLFFANADSFRERILEVVAEAQAPVRWVVIAAEPITDVDTTAAEMLQELDRSLAAQGVELAFAELKDPVKDRLRRYGLHKTIGGEYFFPTLGVAVKAFLAQHPVEWVDWEQGGEG